MACRMTGLCTLSLHDALPISTQSRGRHRESSFLFEFDLPIEGDVRRVPGNPVLIWIVRVVLLRGEVNEERRAGAYRSEEHTSELQSRGHLVCRLLLEKKKKQE